MMDVQLETCRICAKCYLSSSPSDFFHLFQPIDDKECELDFIHKEIDCWQLKISPNDGLPQQICSNCFQKFCTIESFRQECVAAQNLLHRAQEMTESQVQNNITTQKTAPTTILLPGTFILSSAQPISQQCVDNTILQETNNALLSQVNTTQTLEDNILIDVVNDDTAIVNDVATSTHQQYELHSETSWHEAKLFNEVIAQEADTTTLSSTEDCPKKTNNSNDLEDVLKSSIIPKNSKNLLIDNTVVNKLSPPQFEESQCADDTTEDNIPLRIANFPHACNYCYCPAKGSIAHLVFESSEELSQHFFDVHDPKLPYPCPMCPKLFATMANRNRHYVASHGIASKTSNYCVYCSKKLNATQEVHEKNCNFIADWHCKTCKKDYIQMPLHSFRAHQRSHYERHFRCDICNLAFSQNSLLLIHKRSHQKPNSTVNKNDFNCTTCNLVFNSMYDLKSHEFSTHNEKIAFRCKFCAKCYSTLAVLKRHMENAHKKQNNIVEQAKKTCPKCNVTFQSRNKLHCHMQQTKYEKGRCIPIKESFHRAFQCDQCSRYFNSKEQLQLHSESHDIQKRPFACKKCGIRCRTAKDLMQHNKLTHLKLTTFECNKCDEKFAYSKDLEEHKLYHAKLMFRCSYKDCKTNCGNEKDLKQHMREHESVSCEYCGKLFVMHDIEAHIQTTHNNNNNDLENSNFLNILTEPINDFSFNQNHVFDNDADPMDVMQQTSTLVLSQNTDNICAPYIESMESNLLNDNNIFEEQELLAEENNTIANNVDFIMSEETLGVNDSFISSLLDPDYEIVVN